MIKSVAAGTSEATVATEGAGALECLSHPPIQSAANTTSRAMAHLPLRVPSPAVSRVEPCPFVGNLSFIISGGAPGAFQSSPKSKGNRRDAEEDEIGGESNQSFVFSS
jgi:hypothetical protein